MSRPIVPSVPKPAMAYVKKRKDEYKAKMIVVDEPEEEVEAQEEEEPQEKPPCCKPPSISIPKCSMPSCKCFSKGGEEPSAEALAEGSAPGPPEGTVASAIASLEEKAGADLDGDGKKLAPLRARRLRAVRTGDARGASQAQRGPRLPPPGWSVPYF